MDRSMATKVIDIVVEYLMRFNLRYTLELGNCNIQVIELLVSVLLKSVNQPHITSKWMNQ